MAHWRKFRLVEELMCHSGLPGRALETTRELLGEMEAARGVSTIIETQCHSIAHAIGRHSYAQTRLVPQSFDSCDESCHSGCYSLGTPISQNTLA